MNVSVSECYFLRAVGQIEMIIILFKQYVCAAKKIFFFKFPIFYSVHILNCSDQQGTAGLRYSKMERNLRRIKNETFAASPTNGAEIIKVFSDEALIKLFGNTKHDEPELFYRGTLVHENYTCTFFFSEKIRQIIVENIPADRRKYLMDATFKIVPVGCFRQILIIYVEYLEHVRFQTNFSMVIFYFGFKLLLGIPFYLYFNEP